MPPTTISTGPGVIAAGEMAVIYVGEFTVNALADVPPNVTPMRLEKLLPTMVTLAPPAVDPDAGLTPLIVGVADVAGAYVKVSADVVLEVPDIPDTTISTGPDIIASGEIAVMEVGEFTVKELADIPENLTPIT